MEFHRPIILKCHIILHTSINPTMSPLLNTISSLSYLLLWQDNSKDMQTFTFLYLLLCSVFHLSLLCYLFQLLLLYYLWLGYQWPDKDTKMWKGIGMILKVILVSVSDLMKMETKLVYSGKMWKLLICWKSMRMNNFLQM